MCTVVFDLTGFVVTRWMEKLEKAKNMNRAT